MLIVNSVLQAIQNLVRTIVLLAATLLLAGIAVSPVNAQVIDSIEINQTGDEAEIQIQFISRVQYVRQAPLKNGDIRLYFNLRDVDASDPRLIPETKKSPRSDLVPPFTITYPELDGSLTLRFGKVKMWNYKVRPGNDGRSLSIITPVIKTKGEPSPKMPEAVSVTAPPVVSPSVAVPSVAAPGVKQPAGAPPVSVPPASVPPAIIPSEKAALPPVADEAARAPEVAVAPPVKPRTPEENEKEAMRLIGSSQNALLNDRTEMAIGTLNRLLELPPNKQSQVAQKLIGEAREKNGEYAKARVEYETYLKLYPNATDIKEVKDRLLGLSALETARPVKVVTTRTPKKFVADENMTVFGSLAQYYYKGIAHTDTMDATGAAPTSSSVSLTDQSMLISSFDITGRKRSETTDTKIVFRDSYNANNLPGKPRVNRVSAAFVEQGARDKSYMYRLGRQSGSSGGVPGRFDGAVAGYSLNPTWRINGVMGIPVEFTSGGESKKFVGVSADLTRLPEQWSGSGYFVEQRAGGFADRRAIGAEAHYFDAKRNYISQLEYDALFKEVNIGMFQGNWTTEAGDNYFMIADHRKSPSLELANALSNQTVQTLAELLAQPGMSMDTLRADAKALSANSNMLMVGMNRPYTPNVRLGGDFRITNTSGTGATTGVTTVTTTGTTSTGQPASSGSGNTYTVSMQATGNNLFFENDLGVMSASYIHARSYKAQSLAFNQVETFRQYWRLDLALLLYNQKDNDGTRQTKFVPSLKVNYRLNNSVNFEGEGGIEANHTSSATRDDKTRRKFFYVGYRWDFR